MCLPYTLTLPSAATKNKHYMLFSKQCTPIQYPLCVIWCASRLHPRLPRLHWVAVMSRYAPRSVRQCKSVHHVAPAHKDGEAHDILISPLGVSQGWQGARGRSSVSLARGGISFIMMRSSSWALWQVRSASKCLSEEQGRIKGMWHSWEVSNRTTMNILLKVEGLTVGE